MANKRTEIDLRQYFVAIFFVLMVTLFIVVTFFK